MADAKEPLTDWRDRFAKRIRQLRTDHNLTQREVAEAIDVGFEAYRKYEQRGSAPAHVLPDLARLYNISIEFLVTGRQPLAAGPPPEGEGETGGHMTTQSSKVLRSRSKR